MSSIATTRTTWRSTLPAPLRGFLLGLLGTLAVALLLAASAAAAIGLLNQGRVLPGVTVGGVPLGGLDPEAAVARLEASLPSLSQGTATLIIEGQPTRISYAELGRGYRLDDMANDAYAAGRAGNLIEVALGRLRDAVHGTQLPLQVHGYDQSAIDRVAVQVALQHASEAVDASVTVAEDGSLVVSPSTPGAALDPRVVRALLGAAVATPDPDDMTVEIPVTIRQPLVTTGAAQAAATAAHAAIDRPLAITAGEDELTLEPAELASVLRFGLDDAGSYLPRVDRLALGALVADLASRVNREAQDASYTFGATITVVPAVIGHELDATAAEGAIRDAIDARLAGGDPGNVILPVLVTEPALTTEMAKASVSRIERIGTWTTYYIPGISNGYGVNISIPANKLNGLVIAPGDTFDFWHDIGPVTTAQGYRQGGAIINGKSEPTGALAGGICSTSTTLFNAALRAGMQMGERVNHSYYISRYPVGLDATVFADGASVTTMSWTNDTDYPVIIRSITSYGVVRFDLYSVPTGRTVTLTTPVITNRRAAHDVIQYTTSLKPGVSRRVEGVYNGFDASVTRYVRDADGTIIHTDHFFSHYHAVNGLLLVGKSTSTPAPSPTPPPSPTPTPEPSPTP